MKVGIISDVHGNRYALDAVLKNAKALQVEKFLVLGDNVGYYYYPAEVYAALAEVDCIQINGNHEKILRDIKSGSTSLGSITAKYGHGHQLALRDLKPAAWEMIDNKDFQKAIELDGIKILMAHATPWDVETYVYPDATIEVLEKFNLPQYDFIFTGHTHYPHIFKAGSTLAINPGSVGQSRLCGGIANWSILNTSSKTVQPVNTPYNISQLLSDVRKFDPELSYMQSVLTRGNTYE